MNNGKKLARSLRAAYWAMNRYTNALLAVHGITADQFTLLSRLADEDGITQSELARRVSSDSNTIRPMLLLLEKSGLIARNISADARAYSVELTAVGRARLQTMVADTQDCRRRMLSSVGEGSVEDLCKNLETIAQALKDALSTAEETATNKPRNTGVRIPRGKKARRGHN